MEPEEDKVLTENLAEEVYCVVIVLIITHLETLNSFMW